MDLSFALPAARGLHLTALVGLFGMLAYRLAFLPALVRADRQGSVALTHSLDAWTWRALALVLVSAFVWLPLQAAQTAGAEDWSTVWAATPVLTLHTGFGHAWSLRLLLVIGTALAIWRRKQSPDSANTAHPNAGDTTAAAAPPGLHDGSDSPTSSALRGYDGRLMLALLLCGIALILQTEMGHAAASDQTWISIAHGIHILAAAMWLGALLPLLLTVRQLAPAVAVLALRRFSGVGSVAVTALAGSALSLAWEWAGGWVGLVSTDYGRLLLAKLVLLVGLLGLAALHRWRLVPALGNSALGEEAREGAAPADTTPKNAAPGNAATEDATPVAASCTHTASINSCPASAQARLRVSLGIEVLLGLITLALAAGLATQPPGVHDLAVWPFAWRPDPAVLADEGYVRRLTQAAIMALTAGALLIVALFSRRLRVWALAGSLCLLAAAPLPSPSLWLIPAYPSSFQHAPNGFDAESIVLGQQRFAQHCASCHGDDASGRGPRAASLPMWPPNLAGHMLWDRTDGEVFWRIGHGLRNAAGTQTMPGFAAELPEDDIWALVNFLFANAGGMSADKHGGWIKPLRAPVLQLQCGEDMLALDSLRGQVVHVLAMADVSSSALAELARADNGLATTLVLLRNPLPDLPTSSRVCTAIDPSAWTAYAQIAGLTPDTFAGTQILIDREGWLRARYLANDTGWTLPDAPAPRAWQAAQGAALSDSHARLADLIRRIDAAPVEDQRAGHAH
ncbi:c-type cytochrome [Pigmentiphaga aceris]|uniref:C-type cytochrome n=1 Tax=Pigmentiphaga aceris TaxID=1940612 RepID=A0A5C0ASA5_9BURK|nr:CopD family protein [Pigmentiphaga aceris]QEI04855.1 c-type cytochrome [Pigmentiphaga aceris]